VPGGLYGADGIAGWDDVKTASSPSGRCVNLTFHGIGEPTRQLSPGEADVWVSVEQFLSILDVVVGHDDVRLSFDDGEVEHARLPRGRRPCVPFCRRHEDWVPWDAPQALAGVGRLGTAG
jgi:hypothetical protein